MSVGQVAAATGFHPETVYLRDRPLGAELLAAICGAFVISADWLLFGLRPARTRRSSK